jgi:hypothetical protein
MQQAELNRAVARATGETVSTIKRLGFLLADPAEEFGPDKEDAQVIDWDELENGRQTENSWRRQHEPALA